MIELSAFAACAILGVLAIFQFALIVGAPLGRYTQGGSHVVLPPAQRIICVISIVLYAAFALIILSKAGVIDTLENISHIGMWILAAFFFVGVFMNGISRSKPEQIIMTPVALILMLLCASLAIN